MNYGLIIEKVLHRVIKFNQKAWLKPYLQALQQKREGGGGGCRVQYLPFLKNSLWQGWFPGDCSPFSKATKNFLTPHSENLVEGPDFSKLMNNSVIGKTIGEGGRISNVYRVCGLQLGTHFPVRSMADKVFYL